MIGEFGEYEAIDGQPASGENSWDKSPVCVCTVFMILGEPKIKRSIFWKNGKGNIMVMDYDISDRRISKKSI